MGLAVSEVQAAARGLEGRSRHVGNPARRADIAPAIDAAHEAKLDAVIVCRRRHRNNNRKPGIAAGVCSGRCATSVHVRQIEKTSGLKVWYTYGPNRPDLHRRAANHVDKIFQGRSHPTLPVTQPTKFDLVINLSTVRALRPQ